MHVSPEGLIDGSELDVVAALDEFIKSCVLPSSMTDEAADMNRRLEYLRREEEAVCI